jgi:hypothetical protein
MDHISQSILRIHASTTDRIGSKLLYEYIVELAQESGISGATVYRGIMGYGASSKIHSSKFWELTEKLPVVIELVDKTEMLEAFFKGIEDDLYDMPKGCLATIEPVHIIMQKKGK